MASTRDDGKAGPSDSTLVGFVADLMSDITGLPITDHLAIRSARTTQAESAGC